MFQRFEWIIDRLACPRCGASDLNSVSCDQHRSEGFFCQRCDEWYPYLDYTFDFFPYWEFYGPRRRQWVLWRLTQEAGAAAYQSDPDNNLASACRQDTQDFLSFIRETNTRPDTEALDVGSGILLNGPGYSAGNRRFVGIEPILHQIEPNYLTLRATAEFLPFKNQSFDVCFLGTSVDHFLFPQRSLEEIARCLRPAGSVYIWIAVVPEKISLVESCPWPAPFISAATSKREEILAKIEKIGKMTRISNRILKRWVWEAFAYYPPDPTKRGYSVNPSDPYHLGHFSYSQFRDLVVSAGFSVEREHLYREHVAANIREYFMELKV